MNKIFTCLAFLVLIVNYSMAQEICDDGIDNDGDGFIDCFDPDCTSNSDCDGFYIGNDASCEAVPSEFPQFSLGLGYASPVDATNHLSRVAIGDLDRDGIPEIVTQSRNRGRVYVLNGDDATIKAERFIGTPHWRMSIANLEDDDCAEITAVTTNGGYRIVNLDCELNENWTSENLPYDPVHISYADFDRDGQAEMYYKDEIRDPITGTRLIRSTLPDWRAAGGGPVAVDILGDEDLELVFNNRIYRVNLGSRTQDGGTLQLIAVMPEPFRVKNNGQSASTSIADYNLDGFLDVLLTGADDNNVTTVFFWDVRNNTVKKFSDRIDENNYRNGWRNGTGRINVGDLDGDGQLNAVYVSGKYLYALDENWDPLWKDAFGDPDPAVVNEETSGITGCTLFDFNGDGKNEVVYRDEDYLYIVNGTDGSFNTSVHCRSRTNVEYPIVADVDADGSTEICVVCATEDYEPTRSGANLGLYTPAEVRIYESAGEPWVPARRLWNQHAYFNTNVNDDLTIPTNQQKHHLVWSTGECSEGPARPLNGFLNQSPFLSSSGCATYASPDLTIVQGSLSISTPTCPDTDFVISFDLENIGDVALSGSVPISFYDGDPLVAGTNRLGTEFISLSNFGVGDVIPTQNITVTGDGGPFTLYAVLNDDGSSGPAPITLPSTSFLECDYVNNIVSASVDPIPFTLGTIVTNNITCSSGTVPANGSARAFRVLNTDTLTTDYDFFWFNGTDVSGTPDYTGSIYSGLSAGIYSVFAAHKSAGCNSDTVQVEVIDSARVITADIRVDRPLTNCRRPNGKLTVLVNGGEPPGNFTFEWYVGNTVGGGLVISTSQIANNLTTGTYTVLVTEKSTGCQTIESAEVPDEAPTPEFTASSVDIVCSDLNSGSVTATLTSGDPADHTFEWFIGPSVKPTPDFTGATVNNLPAGEYTIVVTNDGSQCPSPPITVSIDQTLAPEINNVSGTDNNSCDSADPNGTVTVDIVGDPADHTVEWFAGGSTTTAVISTDLTVSGLIGGDYTVRLTNNNTGCFVTDNLSIINNIVTPTLSLSANPVTQCDPLNGQVTATVDLDTESDYEFFWYDGDQVKASADYTESSNVLSGLAPGFYTVQAVNNLRNCITDPQTIEVVDQAIISIVADDNAITLPTSCNELNGIIEVQISSPGNTSGFRIDWYAGTSTAGTPFLTESGVTVSTASGLGTGLYTVEATDLDNGCSNQIIINLPYANAHEVATTSTNTSTCNPNNDGTIEAALTPTPVGGFDETAYELRLYNGTDITGTPIDTQPGAPITTFSGLMPGIYTVEAISIDPALGSCSIYAIDTVETDAVLPDITLVDNQPNINCDPSLATGMIEISIDGGANPALYTIEWYAGSIDPSNSVASNTTTVSNLVGGSYIVEVTNGDNCSSTRTFTLNDSPTVVSINTNDIQLIPVTRCDVDNSEARINAVYENGVLANLADFSFEWYDVNMNILPSAATPNNTNVFTGLPEGTYFVRAINSTTGCETSLMEFHILTDIVPPTITLDFANPQRCVSPSLGELRVLATGASATYNYTWYSGTTATGPAIQTGPDLLNQPAGFYTVAIDDDFGCVYTETYELVTIVNELNLTTSATAVTNCDTPNGTVFATVTTAGSYSYSWVDSNGIAVGTGKEITGLPAGIYTVTAVDDTDTFCQATALDTVIVSQQFPNLAIDQLAPITVCDITKANGAARASVNNGFIGYTFDWYEGTSVSGTPIFSGPEYSELRDITYTVRATNNISQCFTDQSITITSDLPIIPVPTIEVEAIDTHCQIDNGALSVSVNGNTAKYIFNWYIGENTSGTPDYRGERIRDLAAGIYTVTATDRATGCVSAPVSVEIEEDLKFPEFDFKIEGVSCGETTGFASLIPLNRVEISRIEWRNEFGSLIETGPNLTNVSSGVFSVYVETAQGCVVEEEITIPTEVNAFNGISRNGDPRNSFFNIECITDFPDNIVKIYNRAGTLVYEVEGYDNNTKVFDGISNRGVNLMGRELPDGTYFYVIDKRDGSKPVTGYLEIVN